MADILKAIILGIVEGLTEFLPVSSTGHLIVINRFISFSDSAFTEMFDIVIQFGAILAVVIYFWDKIWPFGKRKSHIQKAGIWDLWEKTIIGVLPAIVFGAVFESKIKEYLFNYKTVAVALIAGGIILIIIESTGRRCKIRSVQDMSCRTALFIGFIQCLAMVPGTSRSAATIIGAMLLGLSRVAAAEYSFYLAIPTIFAASAYSLVKSGFAMTPEQISLLLAGFVTSFLVAWAVVALFMKFISRHDFKPFGWYRIALGVFIVVFFAII